MTEEEKVETETTEEVTEVAEENTDAETTEEESSEEASDTTIDFKAMAEEEKAKRKELEDKIAGDAYKYRKDKKEVEDVDEEDKPLTKAELTDVLARERVETQKQLRLNEAKEIVKGMTDNMDEQEYILEVHKNRTLPGTLQEQLNEAHAIAHGSKLAGENKELKRALKGKDSVDTNPATTHRKGLPSQAGEPSMSPTDKQALISAGWKWITVNKRYEKKTADGRTLFRQDDGSVRALAK